MEPEVDNIASPEISKQLNLQHSQGKTLTGFSYYDEDDKEKVGFVGIIDNQYYYLKQTKDKGEIWIKCKEEYASRFKNEIKAFPPQQNYL